MIKSSLIPLTYKQVYDNQIKLERKYDDMSREIKVRNKMKKDH